MAASPKIPQPRDGRVDIHSHMLPGIDDGCADIEESIKSVLMLQKLGYVGTICTPHIWPDMYPSNLPLQIAHWVDDLQKELTQRGIDYQLWAGGELRLFNGVLDFLEAHGVPTLAGSKYVLCDFWEPVWEPWIDRVLDGLLAWGYTPIIAHPERLSIPKVMPEKLLELGKRGILFQGNFRCFTGEDSVLADTQIRAWMPRNVYTFLAMDMHRPAALPSRIDGFQIVEREYGRDVLDRMTITHVRKLIFGL